MLSTDKTIYPTACLICCHKSNIIVSSDIGLLDEVYPNGSIKFWSPEKYQEWMRRCETFTLLLVWKFCIKFCRDVTFLTLKIIIPHPLLHMLFAAVYDSRRSLLEYQKIYWSFAVNSFCQGAVIQTFCHNRLCK